MRHTTGPWTSSGYHIVGASGELIANVFTEPEPMRHADRKLIAAAPELLRALSGIMADIYSMEEPYIVVGRYVSTEHFERAKAAIRAAND